jgi:DNA-binding NtrC family response regulator
MRACRALDVLLHSPRDAVNAVLLVDPDVTAVAAVAEWLPPTIELDVRADFPAARARLHAQPPRLLVTALRLREYNGLHLVYLAARAGLPTRSIVYTDGPDQAAAHDSRSAGAFYEVRSQLRISLPSYLNATLPAVDRRDGIRFDRRRLSRGGRRAYDRRNIEAPL